MAKENRQLHAVQDSPAHIARERLAAAMARVEQAVQQRLIETAQAAAQHGVPQEASTEALAQWQENYHTLEQHAAGLQQENARLSSALAEAEQAATELRNLTHKAEEKLAQVMNEIEKILEA